MRSNFAKCLIPALIGFVVFAEGQAKGEYIQGVKIAGVSSESSEYTRYATQVVDGSGLTGEAHTSSPDGSMWDTLPTDDSPWIAFDLGEAQWFKDIHIWNYNAADFAGVTWRERGVRAINIFTSLDGENYDWLGGNWPLSIAPGTDGYLGETLNISGFGRYVRFDILSNYSDQGFSFGTGLSEVRFTATLSSVPEPSSVIMLGCGLLVLGGVRCYRRKVAAA